MVICGLDVLDVELPCIGSKNEEADELRQHTAEDSDAVDLSYVGTAAYDCLRKKHGWHKDSLWNVTTGKVIGELHQTPDVQASWNSESNPSEEHSDWFPEKLCEIMSRTKYWCDILSLGPPDGLFLEKMKEAIENISARAREVDSEGSMFKPPVTIRLMFGNLPGMTTNCNALRDSLTEGLANDGSANIKLWIGAWRFGSSWNHAKIIAVDGRYLSTGGHNLWDGHYLKEKPVHDLSLEMQGRVTHYGHAFANNQWDFIKKKQGTFIGNIAEKIPDAIPLAWKTRVMVSEFPIGIATEFPPVYKFKCNPRYKKLEGSIPVITVGRLGAMMKVPHPILHSDRPSDDAFVAMIDSAKTIIKCTLQDIGPVCFPGTKVALPGCTWPKNYLSSFARAIWEKSVDVEIILSNPHSIPNDLSPTEANYGNGWTCVDVAAEIIKKIRQQFPEAEDDDLREKVNDNLRVCFIRQKQGKTYEDGTTIGLHSKHFIVDDVCCYIGSQNLYVCDLAEWGVIIDDETQVQQIMQEYWEPMWNASYTGEDCDVDEVMDGLDVERDGEDPTNVSAETQQLIDEGGNLGPANHNFYGGED